MKVILLEDVDKLGPLGKEVVVKDGFARNYLLPKKLAVEATAGALKLLEKKKKEREKLNKKLKEEAESLAGKLKNLSPTVSMEAGEGDKLFGSVTSEMIADVLKTEGMDIDRKKIVLGEPIKALGVYNIEIKLHPEVKAEVRIWVVKK